MRLATYNIRHGRRPDGRVDAQLLAAACASLDVDVLALQEVDRHAERSHRVDQAELVAETTGMAMVFGESLTFPSGGSYGNVLLVRGTIEETRVHRLPRRWGSEPRTALCAEVVLDGGRRVAVVATHLSTGPLQARWQLRRVLTLARRLAEAPRPVVVLGDFNLERRRVHPVAARRGLVALPVGPTFPAHAPWRQIDGAVLTPAPERPRCVVRALPVSDHLAVIVQMGQE